MRFCGHVPNSHRNKNPKRLIPYLLEKVIFVDPKRLLSPLDKGKKTFSSTLNVMILRRVRNESVRFGRHIDIEVSYKVLGMLHTMAVGSRGPRTNFPREDKVEVH
jgi:hypothetical protein